MATIETSLKEKAMMEEQRAKTKAEMEFQKKMYVQEQKNSQGLKKEYAIIKKQKDELESEIFHQQDEFNQ